MLPRLLAAALLAAMILVVAAFANPHRPTPAAPSYVEDALFWNCYLQGNGLCQKGAQHQ